MGKRSPGRRSNSCRCSGEETRDLEHRPVDEPDRPSEMWLALAVVGLLLLALCFLTAVWVTAWRGLPGW